MAQLSQPLIDNLPPITVYQKLNELSTGNPDVLLELTRKCRYLMPYCIHRSNVEVLKKAELLDSNGNVPKIVSDIVKIATKTTTANELKRAGHKITLREFRIVLQEYDRPHLQIMEPPQRKHRTENCCTIS